MSRTQPANHVVINGRCMDTLPRLHYDQLVAAAFGRDDGRDYVIAWHVEGTEQRGELERGEAVDACTGLVVDVAEPRA